MIHSQEGQIGNVIWIGGAGLCGIQNVSPGFATIYKQVCSKTAEPDQTASLLLRGRENKKKCEKLCQAYGDRELGVVRVSQNKAGASGYTNLCKPCLSSSGSLLEVVAVGDRSGKHWLFLTNRNLLRKISEEC